MADPTLTPGLADKVLDPNNLVAVVTVGLMYMLWKFTNKRFDLERQEQDEIIKRIDELDRELLKLEAKLDAKDD
jgi:formiminotetrahydrofolate cyclodeaminase